ncbi:MAG TPA: 30S ribosomal protein S12 methylthiotransferase RimO [Gemmatimonadaceae bacterium]|jgi:ribosomal protein S12 methylthiotransferase|nr:30S ribosomal protein S12 methylthiotransferase RimO [Gemmatimonadaceae bacterium]
MKVGFVTLGCDKNTVDSERYLAHLAGYGGEYTDDLRVADVIIVNTCGFIDAAKKESIDALVEAGQYKTDGVCQTVVAVGCMVERHKGELAEALPEVDLFLGASETDTLVEALAQRGLLDQDPLLQHPGTRLYTGGTPHIRYLKISEGCDHGCAFCAIPLMRGKHRSFALDDVVREAQLLELQGAREINLVAQDLAHYGRDLREATVRLPQLLEALVRETSIPWIRMMYLYSAGITPQLLEIVARESRILPYLDMPMQHASDAVLERMRRPERQRTIREKVARFREAVPDVAIRTTCIVGFPGETEEDFHQLLNFLEEVQFERVGVFPYSPQEGTRAAQLTDDVPEAVKRDRVEQLTELQRAITAERYEIRLGRTWTAMVDALDEETGGSIARLPWQADDIDGVTALDEPLQPGTLVDVAAQAVVDDYDFQASVIRVVEPPPRSASTDERRPLPLLSTTIGSFGR